MNAADIAVVEFLNGFVCKCPAFDSFVVFVTDSHLIKTGLLVSLLWWAWFRTGTDRESRGRVIATGAASIAALVLARVLALTLPFRLRPMHNPDLALKLPCGMEPAFLEGWSSFPSDHATLFFALAVGLLSVSRRAGLFAIVCGLVVVCLPRVYLGLHYPSDVLVGAALGTGVAWTFCRIGVAARIARPAFRWLEASPGSFYACMFIATYQVACLFDDARAIGGLVARAVSKLALVLGS